MKTIGLIGGMSWESTLNYYRIINLAVNEKLGGLNSARCVLYSLNFCPIEELQRENGWDECASILTQAALNLEKAGADFFLLCTNTMHKVSEKMEKEVTIPFIHIADVTANALKEKGIAKAGLIGTRYTMEQDFYRGRLEKSGVETLVPDAESRNIINDVIFGELCSGIINAESRRKFIKIIEDLSAAGAEGVILGCTEIGMLVSSSDTSVRLFDTTEIHARSAAMLCMEAEDYKRRNERLIR